MGSPKLTEDFIHSRARETLKTIKTSHTTVGEKAKTTKHATVI